MSLNSLQRVQHADKLPFCVQQPDVSLCSDCVKNGKLPAGASVSDFVNAIDGEHIVAVKEWTSKETLLLLEAVSRFGENWTQVNPFFLLTSSKAAPCALAYIVC